MKFIQAEWAGVSSRDSLPAGYTVSVTLKIIYTQWPGLLRHMIKRSLEKSNGKPLRRIEVERLKIRKPSMSNAEVNKLTWIYDLYRLGQSGGLGVQAATVQHQILQHIVRGFDGKSGTLALTNEDGNSLTIAAGIEIPAQAIGSRIGFGQGIMGWVAEKCEDLLLNGNLGDDPRFSNLVRDKAPRPMSAMCWALKSERGLIGVLSVNGKEGQTPYSEGDLSQGAVLIGFISIVIENARLHLEHQQRIEMLSRMNEEIRLAKQQVEEAQNQLLQSEKMASVGQLAAGVAHEINNPIGFVYSNLGTLEKYVQDTFAMLDIYEHAEGSIADAELLEKLKAAKKKFDIVFLKEDLHALMAESKDGITRVKKIVQNLKDFSHVDAGNVWQFSDLHKGIDSTLSIVNNEIKYKAEVIREYGEIPEVECLSSQINQVFMNLLVNAAHAIEERGTITIRTGRQGEEVWVDFADTGKGIAPEHIKKIFEPFFTTKPIGKGTGLGLSLSYGIVQKHHGRIEVQSEVGKGTAFRVWLPVKQDTEEAIS